MSSEASHVDTFGVPRQVYLTSTRCRF